jgi:pimeloyl-ACP methyl ester carboxylesterase
MTVIALARSATMRAEFQSHDGREPTTPIRTVESRSNEAQATGLSGSGTQAEPGPTQSQRRKSMAEETAGGARNVVLVHGGFVDGSGWEAVHRRLRRDGFDVSVVQNPTTSLADDVTATRRVIAAQDGPVVLVGHSYGGVVITEAGNDPKVSVLVYIAAFAPDSGESVSSLIADPVPGAPVPPILPPEDGFLLLDRSKFAASFAGDLDEDLAAFMADSQVPWGVEALEGAVSHPAWKTKPSWYLVATDDRMIPPPAQRAMSTRAGATVVETPGSHAVYVSQPEAVADLIAKAARNDASTHALAAAAS